MVEIREVTPADWEVMREIRLAALQEAPYAFGSTYAREASFTQEQWLARLHDRAATYLAYLPGLAEPPGSAASTSGEMTTPATSVPRSCRCGSARLPGARRSARRWSR